jgi:hypothetical protein
VHKANAQSIPSVLQHRRQLYRTEGMHNGGSTSLPANLNLPQPYYQTIAYEPAFPPRGNGSDMVRHACQGHLMRRTL